MPRPSSSSAPERARPLTGRAALLRIEEIHRRLRAITPTSTERVTADILARELGVSRNTIKDDLDLLRLVFDAPIVYDARRRTQHYDYARRFELRPLLWLEPEEVLALLVAIRLASHARTFPLGRDLVRALEKIAPMLAGAASFGPDTLDPVFSTGDAAASETDARHFALLCEAITQRREVRLAYRKAKHEPATETRLVHPLHWLVRPDACLLILHEPALGERRTFELARIQSVEFTGATFAPPAGFDLKTYLAGGFGRYLGEPVHTVRVRFAPDFVAFVRERPWQSGQVLVEQPDGRAEAVYRVCHTGDLERYVLAAAGQAEVLAPPEVRARVAAAAAAMNRSHG
jgi:predicted DNA-binding transcriptional regulator YafY